MRRLPIYALLWAMLLLGLAAVLGGAGHNLIFPTAVTCAPFPIDYGPSLGVLAIPFCIGFWAFVAHAAVRSKPWVCPSLLALQYVLAAVALAFVLPDDFKDPNRTPRQVLAAAAAWLIVWGLVYLGGQVTLWWAWAHGSLRRSSGPHRTPPPYRHSKSRPGSKRHHRRARA